MDWLTLFVRPPGELLYFFAMILLSLASLFMALGHRKQQAILQRYAVGIMIVVFVWLGLIFGALLTIIGDFEAAEVLPPLERFVGVITILFVGWAFVMPDDPDARSTVNLLISGISVAVVVGYILTIIHWHTLVGRVDFNLSVPGVTWTFVSFVLSVLGFILIALNYRRIIDTPLKIIFYLLLLIGFGNALFQISQGELIGHDAGIIRLAMFAAMCLVPVLVYRSVIQTLTLQTEALRTAPRPVEIVKPRSEPTSSPAEREAVQLLRALGIILENATADNIADRIIHAVMDILKVDLVAILRLKDANYVDVEIAYDKFMQRSITGMAINLEYQPTLMNSIERRAQRPLLPFRNENELRDLYTRLDIEQIGPVYFQPLSRGKEVVAVLLVALPYSNRELSRAEEELLKGVSVIASNLLALSYDAIDAQYLAEERAIEAMVTGVSPRDVSNEQLVSARQEMQASLKLAREQIAELSKQVSLLKIELEKERQRVAADLGDSQEALSASQQMLALNDANKRLRDERDELAKRLQEAEAALHGAFNTSDEVLYQDMIESLKREKADLEAQYHAMQAELELLRNSSGAVMNPEDIQSILERLTADQLRLKKERDQFKTKLIEIQEQLKTAGIETDTSGLAQLLNQLAEQRAFLQAENADLKREREQLLAERMRLAEAISEETERSERIQRLEETLKMVAGDREVALKQRDKIQREYDDLREKLSVLRARWKELEARANRSASEEAELSRLRAERDQLLAEKQAAEIERDQLLARIDGDRSRVEAIGNSGVGSLTAMIRDLTEQKQALQAQIEQKDARIAELEAQQSSMRYQLQDSELLLSLVQEFRTPMTSIMGYVDLLLSESAGILGEMQRKFLLRVETNVSRLEAMLNDLIKLTELDTGSYVFKPAPIDVTTMIEDTITHFSNQLREKDIVINLKLQEDIPPVSVDRDALHQTLGQLLTNAYLVSPPGAEITLTAFTQQAKLNGETEQDCLFVSIEDQGGGISPDDEQRVFARKYKAENPLIQGLGDTGVGLSIAKALIEAQGGRLWLETKEHIGSKFAFLLPIEAKVNT